MLFGGYPGPLVTLAEDLVNSYSYSRDRELLDRAMLTGIVRPRGWTVPVAVADLPRVRALRPSLRGIFEAPDESAAVDRANDLLGHSGAIPRLVRDPDGPWRFRAHHPGADLPGWLGGTCALALLTIVERGEGARLHRCAETGCHAVFVDVSRNRSRRYCSPAVCGNRANVAAHRARRRDAEWNRTDQEG